MTDIAHRYVQRYGWKPSLPDQRDQHADITGLSIKAEVDPRKQMSRPYDQNRLGSCTGNAVAAAVERHYKLEGVDYMPSRLTIYWLERFIEGAPIDQDTGAYGRDGFKACRRYGMYSEKQWPYDISKFAEDPRKHVGALLSEHKLDHTYRVVYRTLSSFKAVLSNDQTIAIGFSVYESFESSEVAQTGIMPVPGPDEKILGGHEVLVVGYLKSEPNYALVRNSWGTDWGIGGYFIMPWSMILDPNISSDFRTIYRPAP